MSEDLTSRDLEARKRLGLPKAASEKLPSVTSMEALVMQATMLLSTSAQLFQEASKAEDSKERLSYQRHMFKAIAAAGTLHKLIDRLSHGSGIAPPKVTIQMPDGCVYRRDENGDIVMESSAEETVQ